MSKPDRKIIDHAKLSGWGRISHAESELWLPEKISEVIDAVTSTGQRGAIARGCGRSYGDVSTNAHGRVIEMTAMNRIEHYDTASSIIVCQAGVTVGQLVRRFLPDGNVPPVCPGTGFVTVGGAVAHDVHGKNHDKHGSFGDHVEWIDLALPSGEVRRISEEQDNELFRATIGGSGLTGVILRVAFRMLNLGSNAVRVHERSFKDLDEFMQALSIADKQSTYSVGWVDALAKNAQMGRGILITAEAAESFMPVKKRRSISIPFNFPSWTINSLTMKTFNAMYFHRIRGERHTIVDFERFVFPLDALLNWNRLYGNKGVYQFQCVIPHEHAPVAIRKLLQLASSSGAASPLAVMKTMSGYGRGFLSFPRPGFSLALDFPKTRRRQTRVGLLLDIALAYHGSLYLAKDQCIKPDQFRLMYPDVKHFEQVLSETDPRRVIQSDMSRRLRLHTVTGENQ